jgi:septal ring factor EnvC (AmiA/AmiB activator)
MHQEHQQWDSEIKCWRTDLHAWQKECKAVWEKLRELEAAIKKHEEALRQHASSIRLDEERIDNHEQALAKFEAGGSGTDLPGFVPKHQQEADRQTKQRARHEDLKRHHHEFITHFEQTVKQLVRLA